MLHSSGSLLLDLDGVVVESVRRVDDGSRIVRLGTDPRWVGVCPQCGQKSTRSKGWVTTRPRDVRVGPDRPRLEPIPVAARPGRPRDGVAADTAMLSASNLKNLDDVGLKFIVGSRVTKAPGDLASHFPSNRRCVSCRNRFTKELSLGLKAWRRWRQMVEIEFLASVDVEERELVLRPQLAGHRLDRVAITGILCIPAPQPASSS